MDYCGNRKTCEILSCAARMTVTLTFLLVWIFSVSQFLNFHLDLVQTYGSRWRDRPGVPLHIAAPVRPYAELIPTHSVSRRQSFQEQQVLLANIHISFIAGDAAAVPDRDFSVSELTLDDPRYGQFRNCRVRRARSTEL